MREVKGFALRARMFSAKKEYQYYLDLIWLCDYLNIQYVDLEKFKEVAVKRYCNMYNIIQNDNGLAMRSADV